ncbi:MAG: DNA gyrase inhibitor YacG [Steroidobacteraceae bacterium]
MLQLKVPCPTCKRETEWSASSPYRPFCSDRCRLIDLGAWLTGEHAIPGEPVEESPAAGMYDAPAGRGSGSAV